MSVSRSRFRTGSPSCAEVGKVVQAYLDGETTEDYGRLVQHHLDDCRRCGLEAETYRRIKEALARQQVSPDPETVERLREFGRSLTD